MQTALCRNSCTLSPYCGWLLLQWACNDSQVTCVLRGNCVPVMTGNEMIKLSFLRMRSQIYSTRDTSFILWILESVWKCCSKSTVALSTERDAMQEHVVWVLGDSVTACLLSHCHQGVKLLIVQSEVLDEDLCRSHVLELCLGESRKRLLTVRVSAVIVVLQQEKVMCCCTRESHFLFVITTLSETFHIVVTCGVYDGNTSLKHKAHYFCGSHNYCSIFKHFFTQADFIVS